MTMAYDSAGNYYVNTLEDNSNNYEVVGNIHEEVNHDLD
jgi:hypothetical protein